MKAIFTISLLLSLHIVHAQTPGTIDSTFGSNGAAITSVDGSVTTVAPMALQDDGKILIAGTVGFTSIAVIRYNDDGSLDQTFGNEGKITINSFGDELYASDISIQNDGKVMLLATSANDLASFSYSIVLYRFNSDGSPDETFGSDGRVETKFKSLFASKLKILPDNKILVLGDIVTYNWYEEWPILIRYLPNGAPDTTFGKNGRTIKTFKSFSLIPAVSLALQNDGKILFGGYLYDNSNTHYFVARFTENGIPDNSFGNKGIFKTNFGTNVSGVVDLAIQTDGKIIGAGYGPIQSDLHFDIHVFRLNDNGTSDSSFGNNGFVTISLSNTSLLESPSLALQPDGKIIISASNRSSSPYSFLLARFNTDGSTDEGFGANGIVTTSMATDILPWDCVLQTDGKLIVGGTIYSPGKYSFLMIRYLTDLDLRTINVFENSSKVFVYPTPVNRSATFEYDLSDDASVSIQLLSMNGILLRTFLKNETQSLGKYNLQLDFSDITAGVYLLQFNTNENRSVIRIVKQ